MAPVVEILCSLVASLSYEKIKNAGLVTDWNHDVDRTSTASLLQCPFFMVFNVHDHLEFNLPCTSII